MQNNTVKTSEKEGGVNFRRRNLIFIDLETTGLDVYSHEIVEVGCLVVNGENFQIIEEYSTRVRPEHLDTASNESLELIGYSEELWENAVSLEESMSKISKLSKGGMISGWNVAFDWAFIESAFRKLKINSTFNYHKVDVQAIAYSTLYDNHEISNLRLRSVAKYFGYDLGVTHGAGEDIKITYEIFKKLMSMNK